MPQDEPLRHDEADETLWTLAGGTRCVLRRIEPDGIELVAYAADGSVVRREPMLSVNAAIAAAEKWRRESLGTRAL